MRRAIVLAVVGAVAVSVAAAYVRSRGPATLVGARSITSTTAHDFLSEVIQPGGAIVTGAHSSTPLPLTDRVSVQDGTITIPQGGTRPSAITNLVPRNVIVDGSYEGYSSGPVTGDRTPSSRGGRPGDIWLSENTGFQHFVEYSWPDGAHTVKRVVVHWGPWHSRRFRLRVADAAGWLTDPKYCVRVSRKVCTNASGWLDGVSTDVSTLEFTTPVETADVVLIQDKGGGAGWSGDPEGRRPNLMSVEQMDVVTADRVTSIIEVDSNRRDYSSAFVNDGDTREGLHAGESDDAWISKDSRARHFVQANFRTPTDVEQAAIFWGDWGSKRFKLQYLDRKSFVDTSTSEGSWLRSAGSNDTSVVNFDRVTTTAIRIVQDADAGIPPEYDDSKRTGLMSVAELELYSSAAVLPAVDSNFTQPHSPGAPAHPAAYSPKPLNDGRKSNGGFPGQIWVSAETRTQHFAELRFGSEVAVHDVEIEWGRWGSQKSYLEYRKGSAWVQAAGPFAATSGAHMEIPLDPPVSTDRIRIRQPASRGSGSPSEPERTNLMSLDEIRVNPGEPVPQDDSVYTSAPYRLEGPAGTIAFGAIDDVSSGASIRYEISTDDGRTWKPVKSGDSITPPAGDLLRWRAILEPGSRRVPRIFETTLRIVGKPQLVSATLWRDGRRGAVTIGVDDSWATFGRPDPDGAGPFQAGRLNLIGKHGTYFVQSYEDRPKRMASDEPHENDLLLLYPYAEFVKLGHELANHTVSHGCEETSPDELVEEFAEKQGEIESVLADPAKAQSMAWTCGNYDLAKGSVARRYFLSGRGARDGDPTIVSPCNEFSGGGLGLFDAKTRKVETCAWPRGEVQDLLEEPTPRNFMDLRALIPRGTDFGLLTDVKSAFSWAVNEGGWANIVYHNWSENGPGYDDEIEGLVDSHLWVDTQGAVIRYIELRDSLVTRNIQSERTRLDFDARTTLGDADVPELNPAKGEDDSVERVFFGGISVKVSSPKGMGRVSSVEVDGHSVGFRYRLIEGNRYAVFDIPLTRKPTHVRVNWAD